MMFFVKGRNYLANFLHDLHFGRLDRKMIRDFLYQVIFLWNPLRDVTKSIEECFKSLETHAVRSLVCKGPHVSTPAYGCSRVIKADDLYAFDMIDRGKGGLQFTDTVSEAVVTKLVSSGLKNIAKGKLSSQRQFVWVTKTSNLRFLRLVSTEENLATRTRTLLGLNSFANNTLMIQLDYPKNLPHGFQLHSPTFIESDPSAMFRSCVSNSGWGRACNLTTLRDGLPEVVHEEIGFTDQFQIREIGRPETHDDRPIHEFRRTFSQKLGFNLVVDFWKLLHHDGQ